MAVVFLAALRAFAGPAEIDLTPVRVIQSDALMNCPEEIKAAGDRLYVSLRGSAKGGNELERVQAGIAAWDIQRIETPRLLFKFSHPALQGAMDHLVIGNILFVQSLYNATLFSIELKGDAEPRLADTLKLGGREAVAYRLFKVPDQNRVVVSIRNEAAGPTGLVAIVDISDPRRLRLASLVTEPGTWSYDNHATGNAVYSFPYAVGNGKINIYELDREASLRFHGALADPLLDVVHCHLDDHRLLVANFATSSILALDVRDPLAPKIVSRFQDSRMGEPNRIAPDYRRRLLWVAGFRKNTVSVLDMSRPEQFRFVKSFHHELFDVVQTVAYHRDHLFVGSRKSNSLVIFRVDPPLSPTEPSPPAR